MLTTAMRNLDPNLRTNSEPVGFLFRLLVLTLLVFLPLIVDWVRFIPGVESPFPQAYNRMARNLPSGKALWTDSDMRFLKAAYLRQLPARKAVLILGGSRAATIAAAWFPAEDAWNTAVANGGIDDDVAFFEVCVEANRVPDTVILEVSPALMQESDIAKSRAPGIYLDRALRRYGIGKAWLPGDWRFSGSSILPDLHSAYRVLFGLGVEDGVTGWHVFPDGRVDFFERAPVPTAESVYRNLASMRLELGWRTKSQPDEFAALLFRHFLADLRSRGVQVIVFLAPVNPLAWDYYHGRGGYGETWIRGELGSRGIRIAGTYSPIVAHAAPSDFYDAIHPVPALVRRLLGDAGVISNVGDGSGVSR
jgi:hypothetical protein